MKSGFNETDPPMGAGFTSFMPGPEVVDRPHTPEQWVQLLAPGILRTNRKLIATMPNLIEEAKQSRQALEEAFDGIGLVHDQFKLRSKEYMDEMRSFRMTAVAETSLAQKSLSDVRKFFMDKDHEKEIARLREFVELCERLERLKESGFLDRMADTMLKLEES